MASSYSAFLDKITSNPQWMDKVIYFGIGFILASLIVWILKQRAIKNLEVQLKTRIAKLDATLESERYQSKEKIRLLEQAEENLSHAFKALSAEALQHNNTSFLQLAEQTFKKLQDGASQDLESRKKSIGELVAPLKESLNKVELNIREIEKARSNAYVGLTEQIKTLTSNHSLLQKETSNLVKALRAPQTRGRWGEMQLRRVVELAGMVSYCDFVEQVSESDGDGNRLRPDMIVRLPGNRSIVVDSKVPLEAYLTALEVDDDEAKKSQLLRHAKTVADHITKLGRKGYWEQFSPSPEFVVLFIPGEVFFSSAMEHDPSLIERGVQEKVIVATPTTLIALLRAVAYGWRQEQLTENAREISALGKSLYDRVVKLTGHFLNLQKGLDKSVTAYNQALKTLEDDILTTTRKFPELGIQATNQIEKIELLDSVPRRPTLSAEDPQAPDDPAKLI
ncbi:DNA recombination protein RmuC [bacterium]|nr:DNA recombination protein RmuC [bacterium]